MHQLWSDFVHAARRLRAAPVFTTFAIVTLGLGPIPFVLAALLAAYLPARRAAQVDPNVALRHL